MHKDLFFELALDPACGLHASLDALDGAAYAVSGDYKDGIRQLAPDAPPAACVQIALARLPAVLTDADAIERYVSDLGMRPATLRETAALALARPEVFADVGADVVVFGDPLLIADDGETWLPVFPASAKALQVAPRSDAWGDVRIPIVRA